MNIVMKERVKIKSGDLLSASGGGGGGGQLRTTQAQTSLRIRAV